MKIGVCGTMESNDCYVTVSENFTSDNVIEIKSIVDDFFHDEILKCINDTLEELKIKGVNVSINDKGALDFTIKARTITAIERMKNNA